MGTCYVFAAPRVYRPSTTYVFAASQEGQDLSVGDMNTRSRSTEANTKAAKIGRESSQTHDLADAGQTDFCLLLCKKDSRPAGDNVYKEFASNTQTTCGD